MWFRWTNPLRRVVYSYVMLACNAPFPCARPVLFVPILECLDRCRGGKRRPDSSVVSSPSAAAVLVWRTRPGSRSNAGAMWPNSCLGSDHIRPDQVTLDRSRMTGSLPAHEGANEHCWVGSYRTRGVRDDLRSGPAFLPNPHAAQHLQHRTTAGVRHLILLLPCTCFTLVSTVPRRARLQPCSSALSDGSTFSATSRPYANVITE